MKTCLPLILTASIAESDREPFDHLRQRHFPPDRNFLKAHLTMFHRLPGEYRDSLVTRLTESASGVDEFGVHIASIRHLGAGVAFSIESEVLTAIRASLKSTFVGWLSPQDMQPWRPHITVQNKVSKAAADELYGELLAGFQPHSIQIIGIDLWRYLDGPWKHDAFIPFTPA